MFMRFEFFVTDHLNANIVGKELSNTILFPSYDYVYPLQPITLNYPSK